MLPLNTGEVGDHGRKAPSGETVLSIQPNETVKSRWLRVESRDRRVHEDPNLPLKYYMSMDFEWTGLSFSVWSMHTLNGGTMC